MPPIPKPSPPESISTATVVPPVPPPRIAPPPVAPPLVAEIVDAEIVNAADEPASGRAVFRRFFGNVSSAAEWLFGVISLIGLLAVLATIPVLQLLSLGYLLEVSGRVARSGRLRDGFVGVRTAARVGGIVLGTWVLTLPLLFVSEMWSTARLIDPSSNVTQGWGTALVILTVLIVGHILWSWFRGGRLRYFLWPAPIRLARRMLRGGKFVEARDAFWDFVGGLRLPYYFWLGARGFVGAVIWLFLPVTLLAFASRLPQPLAVVAGLTGGLLVAFVVLHLPFLQTYFAAENRLGAMFELRTVRRMFRAAPIACWIALLITLLFALPLYLLKIELTPREVAWLPSLVFIVFIFPARLLTGWAMSRAVGRQQPRHFIFRWAARLAAVPIVAIFTLIVYFTQYLSWYGAYSLYELHAFLVPVPFLGM